MSDTPYHLGPLQDKLSETGLKVIQRSILELRCRDQNFLDVEHVFIALSEIENTLFNETMQSVGVKPHHVLHLLGQELLREREPLNKVFYFADPVRKLLNRSLWLAQQHERQQIESVDLFVAMFTDPHSVPAETLVNLGATLQEVLGSLIRHINERDAQNEALGKKEEPPS
jgi:ATP-dependent Clp protease ATP-binding subunit ClpA